MGDAGAGEAERGNRAIKPADGQRREVLVVAIDRRHYGLPAVEVVELLRVVTCVPLARAPEWIEGVFSLRGTVVPVLDLRSRLGLPAKAAEPSDHLVVVWTWNRLVALRVDRALELAEPDATDGTSVAAVVRLGDELIPLLDLRELVSPAESTLLGAALPLPLPLPGVLAGGSGSS
jgi:purine-binding chemotaxis protein CheW